MSGAAPGPPVALVTGASSGVGEACARALADAGYRVFGSSRDPAFAPSAFEGLTLDVTSDESVRAAVAEVLTRAGRVDLLVNNAGYGLAGAVEETPVEAVRAQLETNFFGALRMIQEVLPGMREQGSGLIVNVSSIGGLMGLPFQGAYSASKFALEGLTEALRQELSGSGVRVALVEPGDLRTRITERRVKSAPAPGSPYRAGWERALAVIEKEERAGAAPRLVGELVVRLAGRRRPRVRYTVGRASQRLSVGLKRLLPGRLFERILISFYGAGGSGGRPPADSSGAPQEAARRGVATGSEGRLAGAPTGGERSRLD